MLYLHSQQRRPGGQLANIPASQMITLAKNFFNTK
jgi:hypothetical protein